MRVADQLQHFNAGITVRKCPVGVRPHKRAAFGHRQLGQITLAFSIFHLADGHVVARHEPRCRIEQKTDAGYRDRHAENRQLEHPQRTIPVAGTQVADNDIGRGSDQGAGTRQYGGVGYRNQEFRRTETEFTTQTQNNRNEQNNHRCVVDKRRRKRYDQQHQQHGQSGMAAGSIDHPLSDKTHRTGADHSPADQKHGTDGDHGRAGKAGYRFCGGQDTGCCQGHHQSNGGQVHRQLFGDQQDQR